jgi:SNF2 family DNA or RNA helicase
VIAPRRALVNVWQAEFNRLTDFNVMASEDPGQRRYATQFVVNGEGRFIEGTVLCLIADDIRLEKYHSAKDPAPTELDPIHACKDFKGNWYRYRSKMQQEFFAIEWGAFIIDEFQRTGLNSRTSLFNISARMIKAQRVWPMSGTPIGGKPRRLWPVLNTIEPQEYKSEWAWIDDWLEVEEDEFFTKGGRRQTKKVGDIRPDRQDEFYEHHKRHLVRRLKREALPGLPLAIEQTIDTPMTKQQQYIYDEFDKNHEVVLDNGQRLSGSGVLAVYTRLRSLSTIAGGQSGKFEPLIEMLDENGIRRQDPEPAARAYIGCVEKKMVNELARRIEHAICDVGILTGDTKDSRPIIDRFNSDDPRPYVIVMTLQTGGTALNLETAGSAHLIDESWDPDESEQFFGRGDRGGRTTPLRCYTYRTPKSIQEYIAAVCEDKKLNNRTVMRYAKQIEEARHG